MVAVTAVSAGDTQDHHGSHRDLLWSGDDVPPGRLDAIIVPTARRPAYLDAAAQLAEALDCTLVTLHSKQWTSADKAAQRLPESLDLIAIDLPAPALLSLPRWETSRLLTERIRENAFGRLLPTTDVSTKRNLALALSRQLGWSNVMFLDDDITCLNPRDVRRAAGLLDLYNAVGLHVCGHHDHSVVCYAYREAGGSQVSFVGAGALVVQLDRCGSFFPSIYNDDWFFLLDGAKGIQPLAMTGRVVQYPYDPFRNPDRARAEEFGDVLAEGIYWLLDQHMTIVDADRVHWNRFLAKRRRFIERVLDMVHGLDIDPAEQKRRVAALKGALGRLALITPELCDSYLRAWQADLQTWHRYLKTLDTGLDRGTALARLTGDDAPPLHYRLGGRGGRPADSPWQVAAMLQSPTTLRSALSSTARHRRPPAQAGAEVACYAFSALP